MLQFAQYEVILRSLRNIQASTKLVPQHKRHLI